MSGREAISSLYETHAGAVHSYALRRSDHDVADEVTARVFLIAWRRRRDVPEDALPWLYGVARRVLAEERRGATRRRALGERLRGSTVEHNHELKLPDQDLAQALQHLSEPDREVLLLCYWEELDTAGLARAMGCSRAAVAVRLHRARRRLRRALEGFEHENSCVMGAESG
ncbi:MAG: RNA polymerase sigma factor [Solirubrobacteraceae bacterium]